MGDISLDSNILEDRCEKETEGEREGERNMCNSAQIHQSLRSPKKKNTILRRRRRRQRRECDKLPDSQLKNVRNHDFDGRFVNKIVVGGGLFEPFMYPNQDI